MGCHGGASPPNHHPHLARLVLARGTAGDAVRLQVHVPKGHLLPLDAELAHAACAGMETRGHAMLSPTRTAVPPKPHHSPINPRLSPVFSTALKSG